MQPEVKLAVLCDYALTSQDGKLSILGMFSQMNLAEMPGVSPPFFVVVVLTLDRGTFPVRFGIVDPTGVSVLPEEPPPIDVEVEMPGADTNLVLQFNNLPLSRPGIYQLQVFVDGRFVHSLPLSVQSAGAEGMEPFRPRFES